MRSRSHRRGGTSSTVVFVLATLMLLTACGAVVERATEEALERAAVPDESGDVTVDIENGGGTESVTVEGGDSRLSVGSGVDLPEGLTIPLPDGGNVTSSGSDGSYVFAAALYPLEEFDQIVGFYADWTAGDGREWNHSESAFSSDEGTVRGAQWISGPSSIAIATCIVDGDGYDTVCVTVNEQR